MLDLATPSLPPGYPAPMPSPSRQAFDAAVDLLRTEHTRNFTIDVQTDTMVLEDEQFEKQQRLEFIQAITTFLREAVPAARDYPDMAQILMELLMFGVRGFKAGRSMEATFEQVEEQIAGGGKLAPPKDKDGDRKAGEMMKAKVAQEKTAVDARLREQELALEAGRLEYEKMKSMNDARMAEMKFQSDEADRQRKHEYELYRLKLEEGKIVGQMQGEQDRNQLASADLQAHYTLEGERLRRDDAARQQDQLYGGQP